MKPVENKNACANNSVTCSCYTQSGDNNCQCNTINTSCISVVKEKTVLSTESNVTVKSNVTDYSSLIQKALDTNIIDIVLLNEKCLKDELDIITSNISKSWAPLKATIVSLVAKIQNPDWDTRNHQTQIGGKYSLRSIDKCYVSDYLYKNSLYDTSTEFALTRSFEKQNHLTNHTLVIFHQKSVKQHF
jgi:hypothetical protein